MIFTDLRLQQYRSYKDSSFELGSGVNIVVGPNAAGKTNLLEAIMVGSVGKSYRTRDINLIGNSYDWARIDLHTNENNLRTVKITIDQAGKAVKNFEIDNKELKRLPVNSRQPVVLFEPNDLQLLESEPSLRREYFDNVIEQYVSSYERYRNHYRRALAQRNALLKQGSKASSQFFAWNLRLVDLGEQLVKQRLELINRINTLLAQTYSSIANKPYSVSLAYESSVAVDNYGTNLLKKLEASVEQDLQRGFTSNGPHRDDFVVYFDERAALLSASRGEVRTLLLSLKVIELKILEEESGTRPLLLLDDVFSELDGARRKALTEFLKDYQTVITTTDADVVVKNFSEKCTVLAL